MVHEVRSLRRLWLVTEQEVIIEEAQVSDAAALSNLLERVSQETDFIVADSILSQTVFCRRTIWRFF